ncbi:MAG TPA: thioredoxin family protein, partial [Acidobacteriaceae bacterium]|nr:thioredoxin family protein [Acidobacteriaceae bacterium]
TVIWLVWVFNQTASPGALVFLLSGFLLLAIAGWVLGRWPAKAPATAAAALILACAVAVPLWSLRVFTTTTPVAHAQSAEWQPFSPQLVANYRAQGKPVFVDFTASWCLSCQVNERLVLKSPEVEREFRTRNFALLRADWTNEDDAITQKLASLGRAGVPTYVIYPASQTEAADVLPELLTKDLVLNAIRKDAP